ncbi:hypothetical protein [Streptomyces sp. NPDC058954]|uniref:hypothetical protein n=1 Tax=Streptomyces sp. NPDC058954 TaxID=3346677 RepID=UPI00368AA4E0
MPLQLLQARGDRVDAFAAAPHQFGDGDLPAVPVRTDVPEEALGLEGQPGVAEEVVGDLGELVGRHHTAPDPRPQPALVCVFDREGARGFQEGDVESGGAIGDRVDGLAECSVLAAQAFADEVAAVLQFLQAGADRLPAVGANGDQVVEGDLPTVAVGADVPEDALRLVREP